MGTHPHGLASREDGRRPERLFALRAVEVGLRRGIDVGLLGGIDVALRRGIGDALRLKTRPGSV
jgi:hypothetical protein